MVARKRGTNPAPEKPGAAGANQPTEPQHVGPTAPIPDTKRTVIRYYSGNEWPEPTEVFRRKDEDFLQQLSKLCREFGIKLVGGDDSFDGVYMQPIGITYQISSMFGTGETRGFTRTQDGSGIAIEWNDEYNLYLTEEEMRVLRNAKERSRVLGESKHNETDY